MGRKEKLRPAAKPVSRAAAAHRAGTDSAHRGRSSRSAASFLGIDLGVILFLAAICAAAYAISIRGAFVYDDERQIVSNTLIQDSRYFWTAMTSDVWAFKGAGQEAVSNYWRPAFVLWLILNDRLFGLESTAGWHLLNIVLHALVTALAYALARRCGLSRPAAAAVGLIFAVHPAHVESVAWISGSPDLLLGAGLLGALLLVLTPRERLSAGAWAGALALYAIAQLSKEVAIFFPMIVFVATVSAAEGAEQEGRRAPPSDSGRSPSAGRAEQGGRPTQSSPPFAESWWTRADASLLKRAALRAAPFAALGAVYFGARVAIVGKVSRNVAEAPGLIGTIVSAPSVAAFYLRQALFPVWIGPSYPLRAVRAGAVGLTNFFLPTAAVLAALVAAVRYARRSRAAAIGLAIGILTLAPAFNINAFLPEHIVHDRYLYLPLLGALLVLGSAGEHLGSKLVREAGATGPTGIAEQAGRRGSAPHAVRAGWTVLGLAVAAAVPLSAQTLRYAGAWTSNLALWEWGVRTDPTSSVSQSMLGDYLQAAKRYPEARAAFDRALAITPVTAAYMGRAEISIDERRFAEAEADLRQVLSVFPDNFQAWERLALCFERQARPDDAAKVLREARERVSAKFCTLTEMLAVVLYQAGHKAEAVAELEGARARVRGEFDPAARLVLYRLGLLYAENGRRSDAAAALREYLELTRDLQDPPTQQTRGEARKALARLGDR